MKEIFYPKMDGIRIFTNMEWYEVEYDKLWHLLYGLINHAFLSTSLKYLRIDWGLRSTSLLDCIIIKKHENSQIHCCVLIFIHHLHSPPNDV